MKLLFIIAVLLLDLYSVAEQSGLLNGPYDGICWGYYTILSNILVIIYFLMALLNELFTVAPLAENPVFSFTVMMSITLTFIIFHFLLMPYLVKAWKEGSGWNPYRLSNLGVHYICPIMTFIYFFCFIDRDGMKTSDGLWWLLSPCAYLVYAAVLAKTGFTFADGEHWAYWFMNFDQLGFRKAGRNLAVLLIGFGLLGLLVAYISIVLR